MDSISGMAIAALAVVACGLAFLSYRLRKELRSRRWTHDELSQRTDLLASENRRLLAQKNTFDSQREQLAEQAARLSAQNDELVAAQAELAAHKDRLESQSRGLTDQVRGLTERNRALTEQNRDLAGRSQTLAGQNRELADQNRTLAELIRELAEKSQAVAEQNRDLADQNRALAMQRDRLAAGDAHAQAPDGGMSYRAFRQLLAALQRMKDVWIDRASPEADTVRSCEQVLRDNMWVLAPDLLPETINANGRTPLRNIVQQHFGKADPSLPPSALGLNLDWTPAICGWFDGRAGIQPAAARSYVIVELLRPRETVGRQAMDRCYAYALALMHAVPELRGERIQCFVIGEQIAKGVHEIRSSFGPKRDGIVSVTPLTYAVLYARAKSVAQTFVALVEQIRAAVPPSRDIPSMAA